MGAPNGDQVESRIPRVGAKILALIDVAQRMRLSDVNSVSALAAFLGLKRDRVRTWTDEGAKTKLIPVRIEDKLADKFRFSRHWSEWTKDDLGGFKKKIEEAWEIAQVGITSGDPRTTFKPMFAATVEWRPKGPGYAGHVQFSCSVRTFHDDEPGPATRIGIKQGYFKLDGISPVTKPIAEARIELNGATLRYLPLNEWEITASPKKDDAIDCDYPVREDEPWFELPPDFASMTATFEVHQEDLWFEMESLVDQRLMVAELRKRLIERARREGVIGREDEVGQKLPLFKQKCEK